MIKLKNLDLKLRKRIESQIKDEDNLKCKISDTQPQRSNAQSLGKAACREEKMLERVRVSFTLFRVRSLDPDNAAASVKFCLDFIRRVGLIKGDENWRIILSVEQVKVKHFSEEQTVIEIEL